MAEEKPKNPPRIKLLSLLFAFTTYMVVFGVLERGIPSPVGMKGEGLLILLALYFLFRVVLTLIYRPKPNV
ncbi:MAG: hypothetical protein HYS33_08115 [Acidobacteria bacterium]|nr:hypothetical protein [Acidobacteriota bacterium]